MIPCEKLGAFNIVSNLKMPGRKVQVSGARMNRNRSRIRYPRLQGLSIGAVEFGNVQMLRVTIQPIQLSTDPIDSDSFQTQTIMTDDGFPFAAVHRCSE